MKRCEISDESLDDYMNYVNQVKITQGSSALKRTTSGLNNLQDVRNLAPSGPRRPGEGVEDEDQGIVFTEKTEQGVVYVYITLLAAGFVIGPKGRSIHQICHNSGADIRSWSTNCTVGSKQPTRALRAFQIQGRSDNILEAMKIMVCAVDRYKELSEGSYAGLIVDKEQVILDITFHYQPPPKHIVPNAARIKSEGFIDKPTNPLIDSMRLPVQDSCMHDRDGSIGSMLPFSPVADVGYCGSPGYVMVPRGALGYTQPPTAATYYQPNQQYYHYVQCLPYKEQNMQTRLSPAAAVAPPVATAPQVNMPYAQHAHSAAQYAAQYAQQTSSAASGSPQAPQPPNAVGQINMQYTHQVPLWSYNTNSGGYLPPSPYQLHSAQSLPPPPPPSAPSPHPHNHNHTNNASSYAPYQPSFYKHNYQLVKQPSISPTGVQDEFRRM